MTPPQPSFDPSMPARPPAPMPPAAPQMFGGLPPPEHVIATSRPRPRVPLRHIALVALVATIAGMLISETMGQAAKGQAANKPPAELGLRFLAPVFVALGVMVFAVLSGSHLTRRLREEEQAVTDAENALRLKQHAFAAHLLTHITATAMYAPLSRIRALCAYVGALVAAKRYEDVSQAVSDLLAEGVPVESQAGLRAAKVYALLREERLVDADRALGELRKMPRDASAGGVGALLLLLEMYRDVRSGHPDEALEQFARRRDVVARELGSRVGDADALAAFAAHSRGRTELATQLWNRALLLQHAADLIERYPELSPLAALTRSAIVPAGGGQ